MAGDGKVMVAVGHAGVFSFADDVEAGFLERADDAIGREVCEEHYAGTRTFRVLAPRVSLRSIRR